MSNTFEKRNETYKNINEVIAVPAFPYNMLMDVTNACNHSCLFCANSKSTRKKGIINPDFARKILKRAYELGTREVGFYATGEPLLNNMLEDYISYAKELGYSYIYLTTNGVLLNPARAQKIVKAGIDSIKFSINASNRWDYERMHGKDDWDIVIENLKYLDKMRKKEKYEFGLYISYIVTKMTKNGKEKFEKDMKPFVDSIAFYDVINQGGNMYEINKYLTGDASASYLVYEGIDICPMPFNTLFVTSEGYLTMCCVDFQNYLVVADLNEEDLSSAWANDYARKIRECHITKQCAGTMCQKCIENSNEEVFPLRPEFATAFDVKKWDKSEEIEKRLTDWKEQ